MNIAGRNQLHFMISAPRSGSTWLATAIAQHPQLAGIEQRLFGSFCELWKQPNGSQAPRITLDCYTEVLSHFWLLHGDRQEKQAIARELTAAFIDTLLEVAARRTGKRIFVDKITPYPNTIRQVLEQIEHFSSASKVIELRRDGRDVVTSLVFDWLHREEPGSPRRRVFVDREPGFQLPRFFDDDVMTRWATHWAEIQQGLTLGRGHLVVRYEDMKSDLSRVLAAIFGFLGVTADPDVCDAAAQAVTFERMTGRPEGSAVPTAKARKGVAGDWQNYFTRRDGQIFHEIAGETLWRLEYEPNANWVDSLPEQLNLTSPPE